MVCDGMGGHEEGETASGAVAEHILQWLYDDVLAWYEEGNGQQILETAWQQMLL